MKLLIVEDCAAVQLRLTAMLRGGETLTELVVARSAHDVLDKLHLINPDAVVLDLPMADGNGLVMLRAIKYIAPETQVFLCSNQTQYRDQALQAGADAFYAKSLEFEDLVDRLLMLSTQLPATARH
jgi:DNA-binding NarL/FixJ family response regulator